MKYHKLRQGVYDANMDIARWNLAVLTWGNASGVDRNEGVFAIKPSGVEYAKLRVEDIVVVSLESGRVVDGVLRPSSDTPAHRELYRRFAAVGGIVHTHSAYATAWCQAGREIPCLGTTHADAFRGAVPLVRCLTEAEVREDYEANTGRAIVEHFEREGLDPMHVPAALQAGHAPFVWGANARKAAECALVLEEVARMAWITLQINPSTALLPACVREKHFQRKHGPHMSYGQS